MNSLLNEWRDGSIDKLDSWDACKYTDALLSASDKQLETVFLTNEEKFGGFLGAVFAHMTGLVANQELGACTDLLAAVRHVLANDNLMHDMFPNASTLLYQLFVHLQNMPNRRPAQVQQLVALLSQLFESVTDLAMHEQAQISLGNFLVPCVNYAMFGFAMNHTSRNASSSNTNLFMACLELQRSAATAFFNLLDGCRDNQVRLKAVLEDKFHDQAQDLGDVLGCVEHRSALLACLHALRCPFVSSGTNNKDNSQHAEQIAELKKLISKLLGRHKMGVFQQLRVGGNERFRDFADLCTAAKSTFSTSIPCKSNLSGALRKVWLDISSSFMAVCVALSASEDQTYHIPVSDILRFSGPDSLSVKIVIAESCKSLADGFIQSDFTVKLQSAWVKEKLIQALIQLKHPQDSTWKASRKTSTSELMFLSPIGEDEDTDDGLGTGRRKVSATEQPIGLSYEDQDAVSDEGLAARARGRSVQRHQSVTRSPISIEKGLKGTKDEPRDCNSSVRDRAAEKEDNKVGVAAAVEAGASTRTAEPAETKPVFGYKIEKRSNDKKGSGANNRKYLDTLETFEEEDSSDESEEWRSAAQAKKNSKIAGDESIEKRMIHKLPKNASASQTPKLLASKCADVADSVVVEPAKKTKTLPKARPAYSACKPYVSRAAASKSRKHASGAKANASHVADCSNVEPDKRCVVASKRIVKRQQAAAVRTAGKNTRALGRTTPTAMSKMDKTLSANPDAERSTDKPKKVTTCKEQCSHKQEGSFRSSAPTASGGKLTKGTASKHEKQERVASSLAGSDQMAKNAKKTGTLKPCEQAGALPTAAFRVSVESQENTNALEPRSTSKYESGKAEVDSDLDKTKVCVAMGNMEAMEVKPALARAETRPEAKDPLLASLEPLEDISPASTAKPKEVATTEALNPVVSVGHPVLTLIRADEALALPMYRWQKHPQSLMMPEEGNDDSLSPSALSSTAPTPKVPQHTDLVASDAIKMSKVTTERKAESSSSSSSPLSADSPIAEAKRKLVFDCTESAAKRPCLQQPKPVIGKTQDSPKLTKEMDANCVSECPSSQDSSNPMSSNQAQRILQMILTLLAERETSLDQIMAQSWALLHDKARVVATQTSKEYHEQVDAFWSSRQAEIDEIASSAEQTRQELVASLQALSEIDTSYLMNLVGSTQLVSLNLASIDELKAELHGLLDKELYPELDRMGNQWIKSTETKRQKVEQADAMMFRLLAMTKTLEKELGDLA